MTTAVLGHMRDMPFKCTMMIVLNFWHFIKSALFPGCRYIVIFDVVNICYLHTITFSYIITPSESSSSSTSSSNIVVVICTFAMLSCF